MAKNKFEKISPETQDESLKIAKAIQRPGQTKEQTKLIAQGIQKGIAQYKKQHKSKSRDLNKKISKVSKAQTVLDEHEVTEPVHHDTSCSNRLPWVLLSLSWCLFIAYIVMTLPSS
ncbi:MAG: DUF2956 domain-containing protein [Methylococcales bacterium]|nr:DUF2956 domain-containing protein [Methylococcales bacterium]